MPAEPTIRQLRAFACVAELGNFTRAAERLGLAQPALSVLVRELEGVLGTRLLDRTTRRVELTEAGHEFREAAEKILAAVERATDQARDRASGRRGRLVVAAPPLIAAAILPGAIAEFRARAEGVRVEVADTRTDLIVAMVRAGEAHCGVGTFGPEREGIASSVLARDRIVAFRPAAPASPARIAWRELGDDPVIVLSRDSGVRALVERGYEAADLELRPAFEVAQVTTALGLAGAGLGAALLPAYAAQQADRYGLVAQELTDPVMARDVSVIHALERSKPAVLEAFVAVLRNHTAAFGRSLPEPPGSRGGS
jgi:DNA-binding transcriptional LysR family regulator